MRETGDPEHIAASAVQQIGAAVDACADAALWSLADSQVEDLVAQAHSLLARVEGTLLLPLIREAERRGLAAALEAPSTAVWLQWLLRVARGHAKGLLELARAVESQVPAVGQALAAGQINHEQAQAISTAVAALPAEVQPWVPPAAEAALVERATQMHPGKLRKLGVRILDHIDPDHADELLRVQLERQERAAAHRRTLSATPAVAGQVRLTGWLDTEGWHTLRTALDPLAAPRPAEDGQPDPRTYCRRMADALVELAGRALAAGDLPAQGGERPVVVVTMDYAKLAAQTGTGALDSGEALSATAVRRVACDAQIIPAVLAGPGAVLDVGRTQRMFSGPLRRALAVRDGGCAFPDCDIPAQWCDGHHVIHCADGGATDLGNGVLLCGHHHRRIHHGGWEVRMAADGLPEFVPPRWIDPTQQPRRHHRHRTPPPHRHAA